MSWPMTRLDVTKARGAGRRGGAGPFWDFRRVGAPQQQLQVVGGSQLVCWRRSGAVCSILASSHAKLRPFASLPSTTASFLEKHFATERAPLSS
jgi:hypothetical protein